MSAEGMDSRPRLPVIGAETPVPLRIGVIIAVCGTLMGATVWATTLSIGQERLRETISQMKTDIAEIRGDVKTLTRKP